MRETNAVPHILLRCILLGLLKFSSALAACDPPGTPGVDTVTCTDTDTNGVASDGGNDTITVESGALITLDFFGIRDPKAFAIDAGDDDDTVFSLGTILADAKAVLTPIITPPAFPLSNIIFNALIKVAPEARGIDGGAGNDTITNTGAVSSTSSATILPGLPAILEGIAKADISATAKAESTGIDSGDSGDTGDTITNSGSLAVDATATAIGASVSLSPTTEDAGKSKLKGDVKASASATGLASGSGADTITNLAAFDVTSSSFILADGVSIIESNGSAAASVKSTSESNAIAIDSGDGDDTLTNDEKITATADATAIALNAAIGGKRDTDPEGKTKVAAEGGAAANSTAIGVAADSVGMPLKETVKQEVKDAFQGGGIDAAGKFESEFFADGNSVAYKFSVSPNPLAIGNDVVTNSGEVGARATATSGAAGLGVSIGGNVSAKVKSEAEATAAAIDLGGGDDTLTNTSTGKLTATASATAIAIDVAIGSEPKPGVTDTIKDKAAIGGGNIAKSAATGIATDGVSSELAIVTEFAADDASTTYRLSVTPEANIAGNDSVTNGGEVEAKATAVNLAAGVGVSSKGKTSADTESSGESAATAIDLGGGNDTLIDNTGKLTATASSTAVAIDVAVGYKSDPAAEGEVESAVKGGAAAKSLATGISADGEGTGTTHTVELVTEDARNTVSYSQTEAHDSGDDSVTNDAEIGAAADATTLAAGVGVTVNGKASADVKSDTEATAAAIDLGGGNDVLTNTHSGKLTASAIADASALNVAVGVESNSSSTDNASRKDGSNSESAADGGATAKATAIGISADGVTGDTQRGGKLILENDGPLLGYGLLLDYSQSETHARGDDTVTNDGDIDAHASSTARAAGVGVTVNDGATVKGAASAKSTSTTEATASAIDLGRGNDTLTNTGKLTVIADSSSQALKVAVSTKGKASSSDGIWNGGIKSEADATGIDAAGAQDRSTVAEVSVDDTGINARYETIKGDIAMNPDKVELGDTADGNDRITNYGDISTHAMAISDAANVAVTSKGTASAISHVEAKAGSTGIKGGQGDDVIQNLLPDPEIYPDLAPGQMTVVAQSLANTGKVTVSGKGVAVDADGLVVNADASWDSGSQSEAVAVGIDGDGGATDTTLVTGHIGSGGVKTVLETKTTNASGADAIINEQAIAVTAEAKAPSLGVALVAEKGLAATVTNVGSEAAATAIRGGGGDDHITNRGKLSSTAEASASAASIAIATKGLAASGSIWDGGTEAVATATGIDADGGEISKTINTTLTAFNGSGATIVHTKTTEAARGNDTVVNDGDIEANATAETSSKDVAITTKGLSAILSRSTATAAADAIRGGDGIDIITNHGKLASIATSMVTPIVLSPTEGGFAIASNAVWEGGVTANATAIGIDADGGERTSRSTVTINAGGGDGGDIDSKNGKEDASGNDVITNTGQIDAAASATTIAPSVAIAWKGVATAISTSTAEAQATAIDGGDGDDRIDNLAWLTANAYANANTINVAVSSAGVTLANDATFLGGTTAYATAAGLKGGSGNDTINNGVPPPDTSNPPDYFEVVPEANDLANIETTATVVAPSIGVSVALAGVAAAETTATTKATATSISVGDGVDTVNNRSQLTTTAFANADAVSVAFNTNGLSVANDALMKGGVKAQAVATGIDGDGVLSETTRPEFNLDTANRLATFGTVTKYAGGNDILTNEATINATGTAAAAAVGVAMTWEEGVAAAVTTSTADSRVAGINAGGGADIITNRGELTTHAYANADTVNVALTGAGVSLAADAVLQGGTNIRSHASGITADGIQTETDLLTLTSGGGRNQAVYERSTDYASGNDTVTNKANIDASAASFGPSVGVSISAAAAAAAANVTSTATSAAIDGGDGADVIDNTAELKATATANADAVNVAVAPYFAVAADALFDGGATARARAVGIDSDGMKRESTTVTVSHDANGSSLAIDQELVKGSGDDTVTNTGKVDATANAFGPSVGVSVAATGASAAVTTMTTDAEAVAIDTGGGTDTVTNSGELNATATSVALTANVGVVPTGGVALAGDAVWDGGTTATANAVGIRSDGIQRSTTRTTLSYGANGFDFNHDPGPGDVVNAISHDVVTNTGAINLISKAYAPTIDVAVSVAGVAGVLSTATAEANSTGIDTGAGDDAIYNGGAMTMFTKANADAINVAVTPAGVAVTGDAAWTGGTHAHAATTGIAAGDGVDTVTNAALIDLTARSVAPSLGVPVAVYGVSSAVTDATATTDATGIDAGDGSDTVDNISLIRTDAHANADSLGVSVNIFGLATANDAVWSGGTHSHATTTGIAGGGGNDVITNGNEDSAAYTTIDVNSKAVSAAGSVPFTFGGVAAAVTTSTARADATAISGGDGEDTVFNNKDSLARSDSTAVAVTGSIGVFGVALASDSVWNGGTHSSAYAYGIDGGKDKDTLINSALLDARSISRANSDQVAVTVIGVAGSIATSTSTADSRGMDGGDGEDTIANHQTINSVADARATSVAVDISGLGAAVAADAYWDGGTHADATAYGIAGGNGNDTLHNTANGVINVGLADSEDAPVSADTDSVGIAATIGIVAGANATSTAITHATAIDGGTGDDLAVNRGALNVNTSADAGGVSVSFVGGGASIADSYFDALTKAEANGVGIAGDAGEDTIYTMENATTNVNAKAVTKDTAVGLGLIGFSTADASTQSIARASGMSGGEGKDLIYQYGTTTATARAETKARSFTLTEVGATTPDANGAAEAYAYGIDAGSGDTNKTTQVANTGTLSADATATATGQNIGIVGTGAALGNANTTAHAEAFGLYAKDGLNNLFNSGSVSATGNADVTAKSIGFSALGYSVSKANATADAHATGVQGGVDKDALTNSETGTIDVTATSTANAKGVSINLIGAARSDALLSATATAVGMYGGAGATGIAEAGKTDDEIVNAGTLNASASSTSTLSNSSWDLAGAAKNIADPVGAVTQANVIGINGGAGNDTIINRGTLTAGGMSQANIGGSSWSLAGKASGDITMSASMQASGIAGGGDADWIQNEGTVTVTGAAETNVTGGARTIFGGTKVDGVATADIIAQGIDTGAGKDVMLNSGTVTVDVTSAATTSNSAKSGFIAGKADTGANADGTATGNGVIAGDGDNVLENDGDINVKAKGVGYAFALADGAKLSWNGDGQARANSTADGRATGILAGNGTNHIVNNKAITVLAQATTVKSLTTTDEVCTETTQTIQECTDPNDASTCHDKQEVVSDCQNQEIVLDAKPTYAAANGNGASGDGNAVSTGTSTAEAYGIKVGGGNNTIINNQAASVTASPDAQALVSVSGGTTGNATGTVTATANASAYGIWAGNGNNEITNNGALTVTAAPKARATADIAAGNGVCIHFLLWDWCIADGTGTGTATASLDSLAVGVRAGEGNNVIVNNGEMTVRAAPEADGVPASVTSSIDVRALNTTVISQAVGIQTGNGKNTVVNTSQGSIDVKAKDLPVAYSCPGGSCAKSFEAIGVQTGDSDDDIVNDGVITTSVPSGAGVAIRAGGGNDVVQLGDGSASIGRIELDAGDDSLIFIGSAKVAGLNDAPGSVNGGAGTDSLYLSGAGSFTGSIQQFENTAKDGAGTFDVSSLPTMQQLKISQGTLQTNSPYSFSPGSSYEVWVYGGVDHGMLQVNDGSASLAGNLTVSKGQGLYRDRTVYSIIRASDGLGGGFDLTTLPAPTPLRSFSLEQRPMELDVVASVQPFMTIAGNQVRRTVAGYLDAIAPVATGDLANVMGEIQNLTDPESFNLALTSLSPEVYDGLTRAAFTAVSAQTTQLFTRIEAVRANDQVSASSVSGFTPIRLAYGGDSQSLASLFDNDNASVRRHGLWLEAFGQRGNQKDDGEGLTGFDSRISSIALGYDRKFGDDWLAGGALAYSRTNLNFNEARANGDISGQYLSLYGGWNRNGAYVQGVLSYGRNSYDQQRWVNVGSIDRLAVSHHDGNVLTTSLSGGFMTQSGAWSRGPYAVLNYARIDEGGFRETGAGGVDLQVGSKNTNALGTELGLRAFRGMKWRNGDLVAEFNAGWHHDFGIDDRVITAGFTGAPGTAFSLQGQDAKRDGAVFGTGLSYVVQNGVTASLRYRGEMQKGYKAHTLFGELRINF